jgi:dihydropyrimidinase
VSRTLIKNGTVHLEDRALVTDVLVADGLIADIGRIGYAIDDCETIDAAGLHLLPGLIDIHTHLDGRVGTCQLADTWATGSEIAIRNGITTLCGFITQGGSAPLQAAVEESLARAAGRSHCDYAFHLTPVGFDKADWACIEKLLADDFRTFKFYTTYREAGLFLDYGKLREAMGRIGDMGAKVLVHCEDDGLLAAARAAVTDASDPYSHALSRPAGAEVEGIARVLEIAQRTKCPCHIVHLSTVEGATLISQARQDLSVTCETCPQYLFLSEESLRQPAGHRYICSPPLRSESIRAQLNQLALQGSFDAYATDHCAFMRTDKDAEKSDYAKVPNGLAGIGALVPLVYELHRDPAALARHLALHPAKIAGLYPRKGAIRKGGDADLVILDAEGPERPVRSSLADVHEPYPGRTTRLGIRRVLRRGETAVENGELKDGQRHTGKRV